MYNGEGRPLRETDRGESPLSANIFLPFLLKVSVMTLLFPLTPLTARSIPYHYVESAGPACLWFCLCDLSRGGIADVATAFHGVEARSARRGPRVGSVQ